MSLDYLHPTFKPFQSSGGICYPSRDYAGINQVGGNGNYSNGGLIPASTGKNLYVPTNYNVDYDKVFKDNMGIEYATAFGGAKAPKKKSSANKKKKSPKKKSTDAKKKKVAPKMKKMWGGEESSGATPLPQRYYNPNLPTVNYPANSTGGIKGAYGNITLGNVGVGNLSPYTESKSPSANMASGMQTGGAKDKKKKTAAQKKRESDKKKKKPTAKKPKRKMHGGQESSGATPMDQRFYDVNAAIVNYPANSGNGVMSAYGPISVGNVGVGMLAPYTASKCSSANLASSMQTGGAKDKKKAAEKKKMMLKKKKMMMMKEKDMKMDKKKKVAKKRTMKGGDGLIPYISDSSVTAVQNGVNGAIGTFSSFLSQLDSDYEKSLDVIRSVKIGNQRLIQEGGAKKKKMTEKEKKMKMDKKKKMMEKDKKKKKVVKKKIMKGGNGSDFATTLSSRGPANYPDDMWGVPGETWFRQFNKTGQYIPNSQLAAAATPGLIGQRSSCVSAYDAMDLNYPSMGQN